MVHLSCSSIKTLVYSPMINPVTIDVKVLHDWPGCKVELHSDGTVVKLGRRVQLEEAEALKVAETIKVPSPRLYKAERINDTENSICMSYVTGERLDEKWASMSNEMKIYVAQQLRDVLTSMRKLVSSDGAVGSCNGGIVRDCRVYFPYTGAPCADESQFNDFLIKDVYEAAPSQLRKALAQRLRTDHRIVFTHGDLTQHNILVDKDGHITGLVDWEYAGWYPEYWEYVKFFQRHSDHMDWKEFATEIFPQLYDDELVDYQALTYWQHR